MGTPFYHIVKDEMQDSDEVPAIYFNQYSEYYMSKEIQKSEVKSWYKSKTIQGLLVALLGLLVRWLDIPIYSEEISLLAAGLLELVGLGYAVYGRVKTNGGSLTK